MKKIFLILNLIMFLTLWSIGQTMSDKVDILWGPDIKAPKKSTLSDIVGYDETGIYTIKGKKKVFNSLIDLTPLDPYHLKRKRLYKTNATYTLEHYDTKLAQSKSVELELKYQKKERKLEGIIHIDNKMFLLSSISIQKQRKNILFIQELNKQTLIPNNNFKKIAEIDFLGKSLINSGNFDYQISRDRSKVLIYYNLPYEKGQNEKFGFHLFDKTMNQLWEKNVTLPYLEELFDVIDYEIDNNGNVHLLGKIYKEKRKNKKRGNPNYKFQVLSFLNNGSQLKEYSVELEGNFITDMQIAVNDERDIICGGFYSSIDTSRIEGSYFLKIDSHTKEIKSKGFQKFGFESITQNMTEKQEKSARKKVAKGKKIGLFRYDLRKIVLRDDGGALLLGEQYHVENTTSTTINSNGSSTSSSTTHYYYNQIIVVNISPDGKIEWTEKIAKKQVTQDDGGFYSSYALSIVKDKLFFVFNDNPKNLYYNGIGKVYNFKKTKESLVVLVTLDRKGNQTREALFSSQKRDVLTRPKVCEQVSENEMVLFGQRKNMHRFAKISFKE